VHLSPLSRLVLRCVAFAAFVFLYLPLVVIGILSFSTARSFVWPPPGWTLEWWHKAASNTGVRSAFWTSVRLGLAATAVALVLGTLLAFAVHRHRFFGRESISFVVILPIALPGIVTGIALNSAFDRAGWSLGFFTVVVGHATFCIVIVYNNVIARLRRLHGALEEASMDLGADLFQTFRYVTFPLVKTAVLAGALLAFALSFDEIVVTTFTAGPGIETLPQWIFNNLARPNQLPIVNVVATVVVVLSVIPVYVAQRLSGDPAALAGR
jgi:putative spermidine/putrescine transport system permease protein